MYIGNKTIIILPLQRKVTERNVYDFNKIITIRRFLLINEFLFVPEFYTNKYSDIR